MGVICCEISPIVQILCCVRQSRFYPGTMTITFCAVLTATFYAKFADHLLHNLVTLIAFASTHFAERMSTCHTYPLLHVSTELEGVRYSTTANSGACSPENASGNGKIRLGPKKFFLGRRLPKLLSKVMLVQNVLERHRSKKTKAVSPECLHEQPMTLASFPSHATMITLLPTPSAIANNSSQLK